MELVKGSRWAIDSSRHEETDIRNLTPEREEKTMHRGGLHQGVGRATNTQGSGERLESQGMTD